jgi:hypothetical protein
MLFVWWSVSVVVWVKRAVALVFVFLVSCVRYFFLLFLWTISSTLLGYLARLVRSSARLYLPTRRIVLLTRPWLLSPKSTFLRWMTLALAACICSETVLWAAEICRLLKLRSFSLPTVTRRRAFYTLPHVFFSFSYGVRLYRAVNLMDRFPQDVNRSILDKMFISIATMIFVGEREKNLFWEQLKSLCASGVTSRFLARLDTTSAPIWSLAGSPSSPDGPDSLEIFETDL